MMFVNCCYFFMFLCALDCPFDVLYADFLRSLLIVVIPFALLQVDSSKFGGRLGSFRFPLTLKTVSL